MIDLRQLSSCPPSILTFFSPQCLGELNNYHSLLAIIMGLNINAIFRLNHTWEVCSIKPGSAGGEVHLQTLQTASGYYNIYNIV